MKEVNQEYVKGILCQDWKKNSSGPLSDVSVLEAMHSGDIFIFPFTTNNLTPLGYNFSPSEIIISTKNGLPLAINEMGGEKFVMVAPHDTVLISTQEYLEVGDSIMGTFHSKVRVASAGFGHISTTLDPNWKGPLLIALNNPSSKRLRLVIRKDGKAVPFVSLIFYRFAQPAIKMHDNPPNRTDVLSEYVANPSSFKKFFFAKQYKNYTHMLQMLYGISGEMVRNTNRDSKTKYEEILLRLEEAIKETQRITCIRGDYTQTLLSMVNLAHEMEVYGASNGILYEMIGNIYAGIGYFAEGHREWTGEVEFENAYMNYLSVCLVQIEREKRGIIWEECYKECAKTIKEKKIYSLLMRVAIGIKWREFLWRIIIIILLAGLMLFTSSHMIKTGSESNVFDAVLIAISTTLFGIISYYYMSSYK